MLVKKAYKYRIYPNQEQRESLAKTFGSVRFVYNQMLEYRIRLYAETKESMSYRQMCTELTELKQEFEWLYDVGSQALQQSLKDLGTAYDRFFRGIGNFPRFKSRKSKQSARFPQGVKIDFASNYIYLPKIGWVKTKFHRFFESDFTGVTVSKNKSGKYFVSILVEEEIEPLPETGYAVGIDVGLKDLLTLDDGTTFENPRWFRESEARIKQLQKKLSRQQKGSNSYQKTRKLLAKTYEKSTNQRKDYHHKVSKWLVENYDLIVTEDLNFQNMSQSLRLGKSVGDAGLGMLMDFISYKAIWYGKEHLKVDRFYPSSKLCSECGWIYKDLQLSEQEWRCESCGTHHYRDINAARNILSYYLGSERAQVEPTPYG